MTKFTAFNVDPLVAEYLSELMKNQQKANAAAPKKRAARKAKPAAPAPAAAPSAPAKTTAASINAEAQQRSGYTPQSPIWGVTIRAIAESLEEAAHNFDESTLRKQVIEVTKELVRREEYNAVKAELWAKQKSGR